MKKYILGLLTVLISTLSITNAGSLTFISSGEGDYSPNEVDLTTDMCNNLRVESYTVSPDLEEDNNVMIDISMEDNFIGISAYKSAEGIQDFEVNCDIRENSPGAFVSAGDDWSFTSLTIAWDSQENPNPGGGSEGGGSSDSTLLPDGTDTLNPVIEGLSDTITEFGPYLIYIALGILGCVVGFFAIKRLVNRIRAKVLSMFK